MIQANELRVGNWLQRVVQLNFADYKEPKYAQVDTIMIRDCMHYRDNWAFEPIPLTPEILEKAGFHKHNNAWVMTDFNENNYTKDYFTIWDYDGIYNLNTTQFPVEIKHLHQLQNLYFALTGDELTYKTISNDTTR